MNLILFEAHEVGEPDVVLLRPDDARCKHIKKVLKCSPGDEIKVGILNGGIGTGVICDDQQDGRLLIRLNSLTPPKEKSVDVDLILCPPRPKSLARLWPVLAQFNVRNIYLCNAERVEKSYFGSHVLSESNIRAGFIEGLQQAAISTRLPTVSIHGKTPLAKFLNKFASEEDYLAKILLHPPLREQESVNLAQFLRRKPDATPTDAKRRILLAIGPEGGWLDDEVELFDKSGFECVILGDNIFTTSVALTGALMVINNFIM